MKRSTQRGFAILETLIIVGVIAMVAAAGWYIYQRQQKNDSASTASTSETIEVVPTAPAVTTAGDLDKATQTLDQTQLDTTADTAQLDKDLVSF